jgi:hypothetical protein
MQPHSLVTGGGVITGAINDTAFEAEWTTQPSVTVAVNVSLDPGSFDDRGKMIQVTESLPPGATTRLVGRKACLKPVTGSAVNE